MVFYFLHSTSVLSFYIDVVLTLSTKQHLYIEIDPILLTKRFFFLGLQIFRRVWNFWSCRPCWPISRKEDAIRTGPGRISWHCDVICTGASPGRISSHCVIICTGTSTGRISSHCDIICTGPGPGGITRANKFTLWRYLHGARARGHHPGE